MPQNCDDASKNRCRVFELIKATLTGLCVNLVPPFAALMAIGILSEPMHGYHIMVLIVVAAGIALAQKHEVTITAWRSVFGVS